MPRKLFFIVARPLVDALRNENFPLPEPPIRFYPDGSLWTDDNRRLLRFNKRGEPEEPRALIGCGGSSFCPVAAFGGDRDDAQYELLYPAACDWMGENENWALTHPMFYYHKRLTDDDYDSAHIRRPKTGQGEKTGQGRKNGTGPITQLFDIVRQSEMTPLSTGAQLRFGKWEPENGHS